MTKPHFITTSAPPSVSSRSWLGAGSNRVMARVFALTFAVLVPTNISADDRLPPDFAGIGLFQVPAIIAAETRAVGLVGNGNPVAARATIDALIKRFPRTPKLHVTSALIAMASNDPETAIQSLLTAQSLGATNLGSVIANPAFAAVADDARLEGLSDQETPSIPDNRQSVIESGQAIVNIHNSHWDGTLSRIRPEFAFPEILALNPAFPGDRDPALEPLRQLIADGLASGNVGDLYDNRDDGHSRLAKPNRTQLSYVSYSGDAKATGVHYGLNTQVLFSAPTFGNSSTAVRGDQWRSLPRLALTTSGGAARLWQLYANNHIYVFPEHRDHDPASGKGRGDLLPANTPYFLISQGSSGSDQPFLKSIQAILAAFKPTVKEILIKHRLIAPTVQQVFRRGMKGVDDDTYLSGAAHPSVFQGENIDLAKMIRLANEIEVETVPPTVQLTMVQESSTRSGIFANGLGEEIFDTPAAIARNWRGPGYSRVYEIDAVTEDINGRDVKVEWQLLRGDPALVRIQPIGPRGSRVRIKVQWQPPQPAEGRPEITSPRIDIGAFADNGVQKSAPAFFSVQFPAHQMRKYDRNKRLRVLDHRVDRRTYVDPVQWPTRNWRDEFAYDEDGRLIGWIRLRDRQRTRFSAHGLKVLSTDALGRPQKAQAVHYPIEAASKGQTLAVERVLPRKFTYKYADKSDRIGTPVPD